VTIVQIALLAVLAATLGQLRRGRELVLLGISALVVFWLQPNEPFGSLLFWLPFATIGVAVLSWAVTSAPQVRGLRQNWPAVAVLLAVIVIADSNRYAGIPGVFTTKSPNPLALLAAIAGMLGFAAMLAMWERARRFWLAAILIGIIASLVFLKTNLLIQLAVNGLMSAHSPIGVSNTAGLAWLGYSYLSFRLMHTIRDRQTGHLPAVTLSEYMNYAIFFPAFTAGPIDRVERFTRDLCAPLHLENEDWIEAGTRLFVGLFKKFVIADMLAVISINDTLVRQVHSAGWLWVFLYAYAFRLYFDFSGYTDIAIGMGRLLGIRLPENFQAPYLKPNLTQFWNSWHMTLTQWFRAYFFNPLTRGMRGARHPLPAWLVILIAQLSTMVLIGLWHGVALGFLLWGLWHGIGLFIHNRWSVFMRPRTPAWLQTPWGKRAANVVGVLLTFNYVAIGWLFFGLARPASAWIALQKLVRLG